eukprot:TRINITY_DN25_c0_g2_i1.p1 TRINITY_DN25_c0_g2~~TRINITY_DN25_c0_g2_i1.p1  ORF type:complete len:1173 (+),score=392.10 TRINITY_DN25_c0_g2_i1:151-3669(+)
MDTQTAAKVLGFPGGIRSSADFEKVRQRSKELYKRYATEKREKDAKRVLQAFEILKEWWKKKTGSSSGGGGGDPSPKASSGSPQASPSPEAGGRPKAVANGSGQSRPPSANGSSAKPSLSSSTASKTSSSSNAAASQLQRTVSNSSAHSRQSSSAPQRSSRHPQSKRHEQPQLARSSSGGLSQPSLTRSSSGGTSTVMPGAVGDRKRAAPAPSAGLCLSLTGGKKAKKVEAKAQPQPKANGLDLLASKLPPSAASVSRAAGTTFVCTCGQSFKSNTLPRCVPLTEAFKCPPCRFRAMDPLNPVFDGHHGLLRMIVVHPPAVPKEARGEATFKFSVNTPKLAEWRQKGHDLEVRMCLMSNNQIVHTWPKSMFFNVNGQQAFAVEAGIAGHKRRDTPNRIASHLKPGKNIIEVKMLDAHVQRYAIAVVRTLPHKTRELIKRVKPFSEDQGKERMANMIFSSLLSGSGEEVQCAGSDCCSLLCPITLSRMHLPARGHKCEHLQCFDLQGYMISNSKMENFNNRWRCPVCNLEIRPPKDLYIDKYMMKILAETDKKDEEVKLDESGKWTVTATASDEPAEDDSDGEFPFDASVFKNSAQADDEEDVLVVTAPAGGDATPGASPDVEDVAMGPAGSPMHESLVDDEDDILIPLGSPDAAVEDDEEDGLVRDTPAGGDADAAAGEEGEDEVLLGKDKDWEELSPEERAAVQQLGWTESSWTEGDSGAFEKTWQALTDAERKAATLLGLNPLDFTQAPEAAGEQLLEIIEEPSPEAAETKAPEVSEEKAPEASEEKVPEASEEKAPEASEEKVPEASEEKAPEAAADKAPEASEEKATEVAADTAPEAADTKAPEASEEKALEAPGKEEAPAADVAQAPSPLATIDVDFNLEEGELLASPAPPLPPATPFCMREDSMLEGGDVLAMDDNEEDAAVEGTTAAAVTEDPYGAVTEDPYGEAFEEGEIMLCSPDREEDAATEEGEEALAKEAADAKEQAEKKTKSTKEAAEAPPAAPPAPAAVANGLKAKEGEEKGKRKKKAEESSEAAKNGLKAGEKDAPAEEPKKKKKSKKHKDRDDKDKDKEKDELEKPPKKPRKEVNGKDTAVPEEPKKTAGKTAMLPPASPASPPGGSSVAAFAAAAAAAAAARKKAAMPEPAQPQRQKSKPKLSCLLDEDEDSEDL